MTINAKSLRMMKKNMFAERESLDEVIEWANACFPTNQLAATTAVVMAMNTTLEVLAKIVEENQSVKTVGEGAEERYAGLTYDCALPQTWVDNMYERGHDVLGHFVWVYDGGFGGRPGPITEQGDLILSKLALIA